MRPEAAGRAEAASRTEAVSQAGSQAGQALVDLCRQARRDDRLAVLEGFHALKHALRFGAGIERVVTADPEKLGRLARDLAPDVASTIERLAEIVPAELFSSLAPQAPETGVLALARRPEADPERILSAAGAGAAPIVLLEEPAHLGNVGAAIRASAAAGAGAVITTGRHDPWNSAAIRGSAGLHFAQPVFRLTALPETRRPLLAIDPEGEVIDPSALPAGAIFAFGSERRGLSPDLLARADQRLAIPMAAGVSSLNLATAVAVALYAWRLSGQGGAPRA